MTMDPPLLPAVEGRSFRVSSDVYLSPERLKAEVEHVFKKTWLNVGRIEELPAAGSYVVKELPGVAASIVISRDENGRLHGVHNVCSHRGQRLLWDRAGNCGNSLTCPYHAWRYGLDGAVRHIPDEESFPGVDRKQLALARIAVDQWEGFVFVNLQPEPPQTLSEYLGEFGASMVGYPFERFSKTCYSWTTEVRANWKLLKDAFQEIYHVGTVHRRTLSQVSNWPDNPYGRPLSVALEGEHIRVSLPANPRAPLLPTALALLPHLPRPAGELPRGVNPQRSPIWIQDIDVFFPNFFIDPSEGKLLGAYYTYNFWPLAVDRTVYEIRIYFPDPENAAERWVQEYQKVLLRDILLEDCKVAEQNHAGIATGVKPYCYFQTHELALVHTLESIDRRIREGAR
ncbi:MAG: 3-phenylpropionate dioxygenase [Panacagrimonas sp.]|jgi:phenylpropionate dioxygenase-like ring-hydroxylating dioxygenase large terminal subunit|nr:aromatic ring-hydroxylating dioxygenase subunit alpha [Panacagrimonas sp.]MCC2655683.1 3-phenylpropionate dioxygenase [Panacagrimonas sp.]